MKTHILICALIWVAVISQSGLAQQYNGTSRWTWPGDLRVHLAQHGYDPSWLDQLSRQQLQAVHDTTHDTTQRGTPDPNDNKRTFPNGGTFQVGRNGSMQAVPNQTRAVPPVPQYPGESRSRDLPEAVQYSDQGGEVRIVQPPPEIHYTPPSQPRVVIEQSQQPRVFIQQPQQSRVYIEQPQQPRVYRPQSRVYQPQPRYYRSQSQPAIRSYSGAGIGVVTPRGAAGIGVGRGSVRPCPT